MGPTARDPLKKKKCHWEAQNALPKRTLSIRLDWADFPMRLAFGVFNTSKWDLCTIHETHNHKLSNSANFSSKLGLTVLFTYLKIILCFQFSVSNKRYPKKKKKNKCRRTEKKEKLENAKEGVKIRFVLFIYFLFCGLSVFWDCIFRFVVRMRDKKDKVQQRKWHNAPSFSYFFQFRLDP